MYKRVVIKLSGEALAGDKAFGFDDGIIDDIVSRINGVMNAGVQAGLVVGGGNFWRGRSGGREMDRVKLDQIGMMATVMNALYLAERFALIGRRAVIMTPVVIGAVTELFNKDKAAQYMNEGCVLVFAAGSGHPFFSTDTITAIRGAELNADALLFAKNVNGVYSSDPNKNKNAVKYTSITYRQILSEDLRVIDLAACGLCIEHGITSVIFGLNEPEGLIRAISGNDSEIYTIGTKVTVNADDRRSDTCEAISVCAKALS